MSPGSGLQNTILPMGFFASGINCGVRRYRPDLGVIYSDRDCVGAGVFTTNSSRGAPVLHCQSVLPSSSIRAVITNSGQANAATGAQGQADNLKMATAVAKHLGVDARQVLTASTGVIGKMLEIEKIEAAIPELIDRATEIADGFALSILTTDLVPKAVTTTVKLAGGKIRITGICKGSGMIHPQMATMLGYLLTDLTLTPDLAQILLREAVDVSFNMISVDGDSSTNDCTFLLASGESNVMITNDEDLLKFKKALTDVAQFLAKTIVSDGEGATKLIEVELKGSPDLQLARRAARGITLSPLIKTAMHGEDPNWGRILSRLGAEQVPETCLAKMTLKVQGTTLFADGSPQNFDRALVRSLLKKSKINIEIDLKSGRESAIAWGCDLSKKYVDINTEYS
jgi:glutamate N-acetyltransferase / amino-acid N-acetyltransferase